MHRILWGRHFWTLTFMLEFNKIKKDCTGCFACYSKCPRQCITMVEDEEGFLYPNLTFPEKCINCGLCEKVCPNINIREYVNIEQKAYVALTSNDNVWRQSSSGGAFTEICNAWGDDNTYIVGAAWDGLYVHHIGVLGVKNISSLCKSKYVSSNIENVYREIREQLKNNKVIFCGTPCQVSGLRAYLNKDYQNLLTIDLICHGVGSPKVFRSCIDVINKQENDNLEQYCFRVKRKYHEMDYLSKLVFSTKTKYVINDQYMQLFLRQLCHRPSCGHNCKYRGRQNRQGDFTIADFKGMKYVLPQLCGSKKNYSTIVVNSSKALHLISILQHYMEIHEVPLLSVVKYNSQFEKQSWIVSERDSFFSDYIKEPLNAITKWTTPFIEYKKSFKIRLFDVLPVPLRRLYLNFRK